MFLKELCDLLEVRRPGPAGPDDEKNAHVFERVVPFPNPDGTTTVKRIDLLGKLRFEGHQEVMNIDGGRERSGSPH
jgi:hypothetical protein